MEAIVEILAQDYGGAPLILWLGSLAVLAFTIFAVSPIELVVEKHEKSWAIRIRRKHKPRP